MVEHPKRKLIPANEITLEDIIHFLRLNIKFLGMVTIALSAIGIFLLLLKPKQYQKKLTLSVQPIPILLSFQPTAQSRLTNEYFPTLSIAQSGRLAVAILQNQQLSQISVNSRYDEINEQIYLSLSSTNLSVLEVASTQIDSQVRSGFQKELNELLKIYLSRIQMELARRQQVLIQLQQQISQSPPKPVPTDTGARREALETERAKTVAQIAALKFDKNYLEQAQKNSAEFTSQVIWVQILSKSNVQPTRSPFVLGIITVIASFMLAVLATIIRDFVAVWHDELSQQKINGKNDI